MNLCVAILGPTASGKSDFAMTLASKINAEIISLDSTTVYQGFDIGSSKPTKEDQARVKHYLVDTLKPEEAFTAHDFVKLADKAIEEIHNKKKIPLLVGGTYFYLRALQHGMYPVADIPSDVAESVEKKYIEDETLNTHQMHEDLKSKDPESAKTIHPNDRYRLLRALAIIEATGKLPSHLKATKAPHQKKRIWLKYGLVMARHDLVQRITARTAKMLEAGLVKETSRLMEAHPQARALKTIGYLETCRFVKNEISEKELLNEIVEKTRQLAKRQMTWLRSDPEIHFIDIRDQDRVQTEINNLRFAMKENA